MLQSFSRPFSRMYEHHHRQSITFLRIPMNRRIIFCCCFRYTQDTKASSLYSRLQKHESSLHSVVNITPIHSNRTLNLQSKSKRKTYRSTSESKSFVPISAQLGFDRLNQSIDIITERAAHLFYNGEYKNSIGILNE